MSNAGALLQRFYDAVTRRDFVAARAYLDDDLVFVGLFETYRNADEYLAALTGLLQVTVRLEVKKIIAEGDDVAVFFELETTDPVAATTFVAEWHQVKNGKIAHARSAFDGRPFEAMFSKWRRLHLWYAPRQSALAMVTRRTGSRCCPRDHCPRASNRRRPHPRRRRDARCAVGSVTAGSSGPPARCWSRCPSCSSPPCSACVPLTRPTPPLP